jgi:hypothetical protein
MRSVHAFDATYASWCRLVQMGNRVRESPGPYRTSGCPACRFANENGMPFSIGEGSTRYLVEVGAKDRDLRDCNLHVVLVGHRLDLLRQLATVGRGGPRDPSACSAKTNQVEHR